MFCAVSSELKLVVASGAKLPALLKGLKAIDAKLLAVVYWGTAADDVVEVRGRHEADPGRVWLIIEGSDADRGCVTVNARMGVENHHGRGQLLCSELTRNQLWSFAPPGAAPCQACHTHAVAPAVMLAWA